MTENLICRTCKQPKNRDELRLRPNGQIKESICHPCRLNRLDPRIYAQYKKDRCNRCKKKWHYTQLDVDHIDSDHSNNDPGNLQTLCANCHRLVTWERNQQKKIAAILATILL